MKLSINLKEPQASAWKAEGRLIKGSCLPRLGGGPFIFISAIIDIMNKFLGKRVLFFTAHPDDEGYVAASTIYKNYQLGGESFLLCATYGEKGTSHIKEKITPNQLKQIRKSELLAAAKILHIKEVKFLGLPDGSLMNKSKAVYSEGLKYINKIKPDLIISFGKDGISGHYDHVTVGTAAMEIGRTLNIDVINFALPQRLSIEATNFLKFRRSAQHYKNSIKYEKPMYKIKVNLRIKKKALRAHKSQMDNRNAFTGFPAFAVKELLKSEYFYKK